MDENVCYFCKNVHGAREPHIWNDINAYEQMAHYSRGVTVTTTKPWEPVRR